MSLGLGSGRSVFFRPAPLKPLQFLYKRRLNVHAVRLRQSLDPIGRNGLERPRTARILAVLAKQSIDCPPEQFGHGGVPIGWYAAVLPMVDVLLQHVQLVPDVRPVLVHGAQLSVHAVKDGLAFRSLGLHGGRHCKRPVE